MLADYYPEVSITNQEKGDNMKKKIVRFAGAFLLGITLATPVVLSAATPDLNNHCLKLCLRLGMKPILCARLCL